MTHARSGEVEGTPPTEDSHKIVGAVLIEAIQKRSVELSMSLAETASILQVSYTYFSALASGRRPISQIKRPVFERIAEFLRVPFVQVLIWAEVVSVEDFVYKETLEQDLDVSYAKMLHDSHWGGIVPDRETWAGTPLRSKLAIVLMYEKIADKRLLEKVKVGKILDRVPG